MAKKQLNFLVVDADPVDVELLRRHIQRVVGWMASVTEANSWFEARKALDSREVDLVFLDYDLGARTGLEVLTDYLKSGYTAPVILLTGESSERIAVKAIKSGIADYLPKERLSSETLVSSVEAALQEARSRQEEQRKRAELERMALTDGLTGLYNRHTFEGRLEQEIERTKRYQHPVSLLMMDLDKFKAVNDTYGHLAGDEVLCEIARVIRENMRSVDVPCRYGGEELCVISPATDKGGAKTLAERLRRLVAEHEFRSPDGESFQVTCSIGVSVFSGQGEVGVDQMVSVADEALYSAKEQGRNRVVLQEIK